MAEPTEDEHEETEASEPTANEQEEPEASEPTERVRKRHSAQSRGSVVRGLAAAALVVALSSLGISLWVLLRPPSTGSSASPTTSPSAPSAQQIADAKTKTCDAFNTVRSAVTLRSNADPGPDPAGVQAEVVAANARLALAVGHSYLLSRLDPATPAPLAAAIRRFADDSEEVAITALAGVNTDDPAQASRLQDLVAVNDQIAELCK